MGQRSGGGLGNPYSRDEGRATGATYTPSYTGGSSSSYSPPAAGYRAPAYGTPSRAGPRAIGGGQPLLVLLIGAVVLLVVGAAALGFALVKTRTSLHSTKASLRTTKAQLASVQGALSRDNSALQTEQQVGTYMRGVRDALVPAQAAYNDSASATSDASAKAADQQVLVALAAAKQKIGAVTVPASLKTADGDIRSAIDMLAGGLQAEIQAIDRQSFTALDAALTLEGQALDRLNTAEGEMYTAVGTAGPASGTS